MQNRFRDTQGRLWTPAVTIGHARRLEDALDVDLLAPHLGEPPLLQRLAADPLLFVEALFLLCRDEAAARNVDAADFERTLDGPTLRAARRAFQANLIEFFPPVDPKRPPRKQAPEKPSRWTWQDVFEMAGVVGLDPDPYTLRELKWLADGRAKLAWNQTSTVLALLFNCHRGPKEEAAHPDHFNPYSGRKAPDEIAYFTADLSFMKPTCGVDPKPAQQPAPTPSPAVENA